MTEDLEKDYWTVSQKELVIETTISEIKVIAEIADSSYLYALCEAYVKELKTLLEIDLNTLHFNSVRGRCDSLIYKFKIKAGLKSE